MEQHTGFEPVHSAWKADVLAIEHQCCIWNIIIIDQNTTKGWLSIKIIL